MSPPPIPLANDVTPLSSIGPTDGKLSPSSSEEAQKAKADFSYTFPQDVTESSPCAELTLVLTVDVQHGAVVHTVASTSDFNPESSSTIHSDGPVLLLGCRSPIVLEALRSSQRSIFIRVSPAPISLDAPFIPEAIFRVFVRSQGTERILRDGVSTTGVVQSGQYDRYSFFVPPPLAGERVQVDISLTPFNGDPDIFVLQPIADAVSSSDLNDPMDLLSQSQYLSSKFAVYPDRYTYTWHASSRGPELISFDSSSPHFKPGWYRIAVAASLPSAAHADSPSTLTGPANSAAYYLSVTVGRQGAVVDGVPTFASVGLRDERSLEWIIPQGNPNTALSADVTKHVCEPSASKPSPVASLTINVQFGVVKVCIVDKTDTAKAAGCIESAIVNPDKPFSFAALACELPNRMHIHISGEWSGPSSFFALSTVLNVGWLPSGLNLYDTLIAPHQASVAPLSANANVKYERLYKVRISPRIDDDVNLSVVMRLTSPPLPGQTVSLSAFTSIDKLLADADGLSAAPIDSSLSLSLSVPVSTFKKTAVSSTSPPLPTWAYIKISSSNPHPPAASPLIFSMLVNILDEPISLLPNAPTFVEVQPGDHRKLKFVLGSAALTGSTSSSVSFSLKVEQCSGLAGVIVAPRETKLWAKSPDTWDAVGGIGHDIVIHLPDSFDDNSVSVPYHALLANMSPHPASDDVPSALLGGLTRPARLAPGLPLAVRVTLVARADGKGAEGAVAAGESMGHLHAVLDTVFFPFLLAKKDGSPFKDPDTGGPAYGLVFRSPRYLYDAGAFKGRGTPKLDLITPWIPFKAAVDGSFLTNWDGTQFGNACGVERAIANRDKDKSREASRVIIPRLLVAPDPSKRLVAPSTTYVSSVASTREDDVFVSFVPEDRIGWASALAVVSLKSSAANTETERLVVPVRNNANTINKRRLLAIWGGAEPSPTIIDRIVIGTVATGGLGNVFTEVPGVWPAWVGEAVSKIGNEGWIGWLKPETGGGGVVIMGILIIICCLVIVYVWTRQKAEEEKFVRIRTFDNQLNSLGSGGVADSVAGSHYENSNIENMYPIAMMRVKTAIESSVEAGKSLASFFANVIRGKTLVGASDREMGLMQHDDHLDHLNYQDGFEGARGYHPPFVSSADHDYHYIDHNNNNNNINNNNNNIDAINNIGFDPSDIEKKQGGFQWMSRLATGLNSVVHSVQTKKESLNENSQTQSLIRLDTNNNTNNALFLDAPPIIHAKANNRGDNNSNNTQNLAHNSPGYEVVSSPLRQVTQGNLNINGNSYNTEEMKRNALVNLHISAPSPTSARYHAPDLDPNAASHLVLGLNTSQTTRQRQVTSDEATQKVIPPRDLLGLHE